MTTPPQVFAFEVWMKGEKQYGRVVNAATRNQAKVSYWHEIRECCPDYPYISIRCRKRGAPHTSRAFEKNAAYRGWAGVRCGARVQVGQSRGTIIGHNASANFDVLFDGDDPAYPGLTLNCHPGDCVKLTSQPT